MLGKKITLTVTGNDNTVATSDATSAVTESVAISEVKLSNEVPKVGDTLVATAYDANGEDISDDCTFQWYRVTLNGNVVKIANATKNSYVVRDIDAAGATLYAVATDSLGNSYMSDEASIVDAEDVTSVAINGMSSKLGLSKANDVPVIGDELSVSLSTLSPGIEYQWYRSGANIAGADKSTYTVVADDQLTNLEVEITIPDNAGYVFKADCFSNAGNVAVNGTGKIARINFRNKAAVDLNTTEVKLTKMDPVKGDIITASVAVDKNKDGDNTDSGDRLSTDEANFDWYRDEVKAENRIAKVGTAATWQTGKSYTISGDDVGHKVIAVVSGKDNLGYTKSIQVETETLCEDVKTVTLSGAAVIDKTHANVGEEFKASAAGTGGAVDAKKLIFTWTRNGEEIASGVGVDTYTLTADDATYLKDMTGERTVSYAVQVEGTGSCVGSATSTAVNLAKYNNADKSNGVIVVSMKNATMGKWAQGSNEKVANGDKLQIVTSPAYAINSLDISWVYSDGVAGTAEIHKVVSADGTLVVDKTLGKTVQAVVKLKASSDYTGVKAEGGESAGIVVERGADASTAPTWATVSTSVHVASADADLANQLVVDGGGTATESVSGNGTVMNIYLPGSDLGALTYEITNGKSGSEKKTYTDAEVGRYIVPSLAKGDGTEAKTIKRADGTALTFKDGMYRIAPQDIGQTFEITYTNAALNTKQSVKTTAAVKSTRTITEIKILTPAGDLTSSTKVAFDKATTVAQLDNNTVYHVYALDNEGEVINNDDNNNMTVACYKDNKYYRQVTTGYNAGDYVTIDGKDLTVKDVITIEAIPDGLFFSGDRASYTFTSGVAD